MNTRNLSYVVSELKACLPFLLSRDVTLDQKTDLAICLYVHNRCFYSGLKKIRIQESKGSDVTLIAVSQNDEKYVCKHPDERFVDECKELLRKRIRQDVKTLNKIKFADVPREKERLILSIATGFYQLKDLYIDFIESE